MLRKAYESNSSPSSGTTRSTNGSSHPLAFLGNGQYQDQRQAPGYFPEAARRCNGGGGGGGGGGHGNRLDAEVDEVRERASGEYLHQCRQRRVEEEQVKRVEEERLQEIISLCQKYNEEHPPGNGTRFWSECQRQEEAVARCTKNMSLPLTSFCEPSNNNLPVHRLKEEQCSEGYETRLDVDSPSSTISSQKDGLNGEREGRGEGVANRKSESSETLNALLMEEALLRGEIEEMRHQKFSDAEDEELKEFQKIERDIKLSEMMKCLESIETQVNDRKMFFSEYRESSGSQAPLARAESSEGSEYGEEAEGEENCDEEEDGSDQPDGALPLGRTHFIKSDSASVAPRYVQRISQGITKQPNRQQHRPLTLYLPSANENLDLISHIQTLGHDLSLFAHYIQLTNYTCSGYLWKLCSNSEKKWKKRYFHFDRQNKVFVYYKTLSHFKKLKTPKSGVYFDEIQDVYVDHLRTKQRPSATAGNGGSLMRRKSSARSVFVVATARRQFTLSTFVSEVMRIWIDVVFTGAQAYQDFE